MGLHAAIDISADWGFPTVTPYYGIPVDYSAAISAFCDTFMSKSTELVPVDTGYLRSTINASGSGTLITADVDAEYAEYVEYGTWKMSAQPYFEPAFAEASQVAYSVAYQIYKQAQEVEAQQRASDLQSQGVAMISSGNIFMAVFMIFLQALVMTVIEFIQRLFSMEDDD